MYFSDREKQLLNLLLATTSTVSLDLAARELEVSQRTIYRELATIEETLMNYRIKLIKQANGGFQLVGAATDLQKLKADLAETAPAFRTRERQSYLICQLLLTEEPLKLAGLAQDFGVSLGTINSDLAKITEILAEFQLELTRGKGKSIGIVSNEETLRLIVSGLITSELNEYEFLELLQNQEIAGHLAELSQKRMPFLGFLQARYLQMASVISLKMRAKYFDEVSESGLMQFTIILSLTMMRVATGHELEQLQQPEKLEGNTSFTKEITEFLQAEVEAATTITFSQLEVQFLMRMVNGVRFFTKQDILSDNYDLELVYQVKEFIQVVSEKVGWDFTKDYGFFTGLVTHLGSTLTRSFGPIPQVEDHLLATIRERYPKIYQGIMAGLEAVFPDHYFSENECIYLVIHFASSLENARQPHGLRALVICSSGIGTSRMLENRLERNFPEMTEISVIPLLKIKQQDFTQFDFIFSTILLPRFANHYYLISPMLLNEEVAMIRELITDYTSQFQLAAKLEPERKSEVQKHEYSLLEINQYTSKALHLIQLLLLEELQADLTLEAALGYICQQLEAAGILTQPQQIQQKLVERMELAPLGIPNTTMALFHTRDKAIQTSYFGMYQLATGIEIMGIDRQPMELKRILFMVGPDPLDSISQELLGMISGTIIENEQTIQAFDAGSEAEVRGIIEKLFRNYLVQQL